MYIKPVWSIGWLNKIRSIYFVWFYLALPIVLFNSKQDYMVSKPILLENVWWQQGFKFQIVLLYALTQHYSWSRCLYCKFLQRVVFKFIVKWMLFNYCYRHISEIHSNILSLDYTFLHPANLYCAVCILGRANLLKFQSIWCCRFSQLDQLCLSKVLYEIVADKKGTILLACPHVWGHAPPVGHVGFIFHSVAIVGPMLNSNPQFYRIYFSYSFSRCYRSKYNKIYYNIK